MQKAGILLLVLITLFVIDSDGQSPSKKISAGGYELEAAAVDTSLNEAFCQVGQMAQFPGGMSSLVAYAHRRISYPKTAVKDSVQGTVILQFTIDEKGNVINKTVFKNVRTDLDAVCLRMLQGMPAWEPARLNGKTVAVMLKWSITFVLID